MHALDVLGDPLRRQILELLGSSELTVGELCESLQRHHRISQPGVSQHLRVLREGGLVSVRPDGARRLYSVRADKLRDVDEWLDQFRQSWAGPLDSLATEVARGKRKRRTQSRSRTPSTRRRKTA